MKEAFASAGLLLEVDFFTTKSITQFETDTRTVPAESNFAASIRNNNDLIAGSQPLYVRFKSILDGVQHVARSVHIQYLGATDKGSILVIKHIKQLDNIMKSVSKIVINKVKENNAFWISLLHFDLVALLRATYQNRSDAKVSAAEPQVPWEPDLLAIYGSNPRVIKKALGNSSVDVEGVLTEEANTQGTDLCKALAALPIYTDLSSPLERIKRAAKLLSGMVPEVESLHVRYSVTHSNESLLMVGSEYVTSNSTNWRFSLKFILCRLRDYFDSVSVTNYADDGGKTDLYFAVKRLSEPLNAFALRMQNLIYRFGLTQSMTHEQIDVMYARITHQQIDDLKRDPQLNPRLSRAFKGLQELGRNKLDETFKIIAKKSPEIKGARENVTTAGARIISHLDILQNSETKEETKETIDQVLPFFIALYNLVHIAAGALDLSGTDTKRGKRGDAKNGAIVQSLGIDLGSRRHNVGNNRGTRSKKKSIFSDDLLVSDADDSDDLETDDDDDDDEPFDDRLEVLANRIDALEDKVMQMGKKIEHDFRELRRRFLKHQNDFRRRRRNEYDPEERKEIIRALRYLERKLLY